MTESELTGDEKYLMCMGYLQYIVMNINPESNHYVDVNLFQEIVFRLEKKFTNNTFSERNKLLDKFVTFSCAEILDDIITEIENEIEIKDNGTT